MRALTETYYGQYAQTRIDEAQQVVDRHVVCAYTGVCLGCGRPGPCGDLDQAQQTLARYARLPNRQPGASLARPPDNRPRWSDWFTAHRRSGVTPSEPPDDPREDDQPTEPERTT